MSDAGKSLASPAVELPEAEFTCPKHGPYWGQAILFQGEDSGGNINIPPRCPRCEEEEAAEAAEWEESAREKRTLKRLVEMNIGKKYWQADFDNFDAYTPELTRHLENARRFAENPKGQLIMLGNHGTGKNHLAAAILKAAGGVVYTAYEIGVMLRQSYAGDGSEWEVLKKLCEVPLLVIDEVERAKESEAKGQWLSHVVGKRYNNLLPIIFISNCHIQDECRNPIKPCPMCIEFHLGNDVLSRILEDGKMMKFTGEDYRERKRMARLKAGGEAYA